MRLLASQYAIKVINFSGTLSMSKLSIKQQLYTAYAKQKQPGAVKKRRSQAK